MPMRVRLTLKPSPTNVRLQPRRLMVAPAAVGCRVGQTIPDRISRREDRCEVTFAGRSVPEFLGYGIECRESNGR